MGKRSVLSKIIIFIVSAGFIATGVFVLVDNSRYTKNGVPTEATITDIHSYVDSNGDTEHTVTVMFEVGGETYGGSLGVYVSGMKVGDKVEVFYMPDNPNDFGCPEYSVLPAVICFVAAAVIACFVVVPVVVSKAKKAKLKRLKESGKHVVARICQVKESNTRINGREVARLVCMTADGREYVRKVLLGSDFYDVGDDIDVYEDLSTGKYSIDLDEYQRRRKEKISARFSRNDSGEEQSTDTE